VCTLSAASLQHCLFGNEPYKIKHYCDHPARIPGIGDPLSFDAQTKTTVVEVYFHGNCGFTTVAQDHSAYSTLGMGENCFQRSK
jgi:hypothetical protein